MPPYNDPDDQPESDTGEMLALKILCLALGVAFMLAGFATVAAGHQLGGISMLALGVYGTAASLVGLRHGPPAVRVFRPVPVALLGALAMLSFATAS